MPPLNGNEEGESELDVEDSEGEEFEEEMDDEDGAESTDSFDPIADLPDYMVERVMKLKEIEDIRKPIMEQYIVERAALEQKYANLQLPLNEQRRAIVAGERDEEIAAEAARDNYDNPGFNDKFNIDADDTAVFGTGKKEVGVPHFWVGAMSRIEAISEAITEEDLPCLELLHDVECIDDTDGKGFTLKFVFNENDYFFDKVLTKSYRSPNLLISDEPLLTNVEGQKIQWKQRKCLTTTVIEKAQRGRGKNAGQVRVTKKVEKKASFFNWFDPPSPPEDTEDIDEEQVAEYEEIMEDDFEIAMAFKTRIVPYATLYYNNEELDEAMRQAEKLEHAQEQQVAQGSDE